MVNPTIGIQIQRYDDEPLSSISASMSVVGFVGTAPNANATQFPLNEPVLVFSNDTAKLTALGSTGTLIDAIKGINDQLTALQSAAKVVVVRVAEGVDVDATIANIVGSSTSKTGIWALTKAGEVLGVMPRLIACPGYTSQTKQGIFSSTITAPGAGGANGTFALGFTGGTGTGAAGTFTVAGGVLTAITITSGGVYTVAPTPTFTASAGLAGATATLNIHALANPVVAALPAVLNNLLAHAFVGGPASTLQAFTDWRETIGSDRIIPVETAVKVGTAAVVKPSEAYIIGSQVAVDFENGGVPSRTACNRAIFGIVGPNRPIGFSLTDGATEGQQILLLNGGVIVRGEAGVETAIADSGFIYLGTDNAGTNETWRQYNVTRMRDYIHLTLLKTLRQYLGRYEITGHVVQSILNTVTLFLRELKAGDHIIGYKTGLPAGGNPATALRLGKLEIMFRAEEAPTLKRIVIQSYRYLESLDDLITQLETQLNAAA